MRDSFPTRGRRGSPVVIHKSSSQEGQSRALPSSRLPILQAQKLHTLRHHLDRGAVHAVLLPGLTPQAADDADEVALAEDREALRDGVEGDDQEPVGPLGPLAVFLLVAGGNRETQKREVGAVLALFEKWGLAEVTGESDAVHVGISFRVFRCPSPRRKGRRKKATKEIFRLGAGGPSRTIKPHSSRASAAGWRPQPTSSPGRVVGCRAKGRPQAGEKQTSQANGAAACPSCRWG